MRRNVIEIEESEFHSKSFSEVKKTLIFAITDPKQRWLKLSPTLDNLDQRI